MPSIDATYFEGMINPIYPPELQLNKANTTNTKALFLDLHICVANGFAFAFDFDVVNFQFLGGDVSRHASYCLYIS